MNTIIQTTFSSYQNIFAPLLSYKEDDSLKILLPQLINRVRQPPPQTSSVVGKIYHFFAYPFETHTILSGYDKSEIKLLKKRFNYWHDYLSQEQIKNEYTAAFKFLVQLSNQLVKKNTISTIKFKLRKDSVANDSLFKAINRFEQRLFHILATPHHHQIEAGLSEYIISTPLLIQGIENSSKSSLNLAQDDLENQKDSKEQVFAKDILQQRLAKFSSENDRNWKKAFHEEILSLGQKEDWVNLASCLDSLQIRQIFKLVSSDSAIDNQWLLDFIFNLSCEDLLKALDTIDEDTIRKINAMLIFLAKGREMEELHRPFNLQRTYIISFYINQTNNKIDALNEKLRALNHPDQINFKEHLEPILSMREEAILRKMRFKKFQSLIKNLFSQFYETTKLIHGFTDEAPFEWRKGSDDRRQGISEIEEKFDEIIARLDDKVFKESGMPFDIIHGLVFKTYGLTAENFSITITNDSFSITAHEIDPPLASKQQSTDHEKRSLTAPPLIRNVQNFFAELIKKINKPLNKQEFKWLKRNFNHWHDELSYEQIREEYTPSFIFLIELADELKKNNTLDHIKITLKRQSVDNESLFAAINRLDQRLVHILATPHNHQIDTYQPKVGIVSRFSLAKRNSPPPLITKSLKNQYDLKKQIVFRKAVMQRFANIKAITCENWKQPLHQELLSLKQKEEWESLATIVNPSQIKQIFALIGTDPFIESRWLLDFIFNLPCEKLLTALETVDHDKLRELNKHLVTLSKERDIASLHQAFTIQRTFIISTYINDANRRIDVLNEKLRNLTNPHQIDFKKHIKPIFSIRAEATIRKNRFMKFQTLIKNLFNQFYETTKLMHGFIDTASLDWHKGSHQKKHRVSEIEEKFDEIIRRLDDKEFREPGMPFDIIHGLVFSTYELTDEDSSIDVLGSWNIVKAQQYYKAGLLGDLSQKEFYDSLLHSNPYKRGYEMLKNKRIGTIKQLKKHHIYNRHFLEEYLAYTSNFLYNKDPVEKVLNHWNLKAEELYDLRLLGKTSNKELNQLDCARPLIKIACDYLAKFRLTHVKDLKVQRIYNKRNLSDFLQFHSTFNQANISIHAIFKAWKLDNFQAFAKLGLFKGISKKELAEIAANPDKEFYLKFVDIFLKKLNLESYEDLKENKIYNKNLLRNYIRFN